MYIWEDPEWPAFYWDAERVVDALARARYAQGRLHGQMRRIGFELQQEVTLRALTDDVVKTSEIEGEVLSRASVRSSLAHRLGIPEAVRTRSDRRTDGVVEMTLDATRNAAAPVTAKRVFTWHRLLFPSAAVARHRIRIGVWRDDRFGPMQVVSGAMGRERVHFQAPPATRVAKEMTRFLEWLNASPAMDGIMQSAIAHLWFVTIHPFDDGNGRSARAIADLVLTRSEGSAQRFYSMSSQIMRERPSYYSALQRAQHGGLEITDWILWFLDCLTRAIEYAEVTCADVLRKADWWQRHMGEHFSDRQRRVLNRLFDNFEGAITARKWAKLGKVSLATAQRDVVDLVERGVLVPNPGGSKRTSYSIG